MVNCLFYWGVDFVKGDENGEIFLYFVVKKKIKSVCIILLDYGVKVDVEDMYGNMLYIFVF